MKFLVAQLLWFIALSGAYVSNAQLREFDITPVQNNRIPVFRDYPDMAAVIVNSSLTNLRFDSNLEIVAMLGNPNQGEYILMVRPVRQIVSVNAAGYQQGRVQISLTEARQVVYYKVEPKEVVLSTLPVTIRVTPTDARVTIDGKPADLARPVPLEPGTHAVRVEKQGFRTLDREIRVSESALLFEFSLTPIEPVPLTIRTQPAGATVLLDGVQVGVTDRSGALGLFRFPGSYELSIQLSGYVPDTRTITVNESGANTISASLVRNAGTLRLTVTPADATVLVNRQTVDHSQPIELAPGMVRIEVSKDGYEPFAETVEIQRGQTASRTFSLTAHVGGLQITTTPFEAVWTLTDAAGRVAANGTGLARKTGIPAGNYTLHVKAAGHQDFSETVRIGRDQVLEKSVSLREGPPPCGATLTDFDGNTYKTVQIGNQCWMAENLRTSKYRDGTPIPNVTGNSQWGGLTTGAWAHYDNQAANETKYGRLYNWYAVADRRNICPVGWHVPTDAEWTVLSNQLGSDPGHKMKSTSGWTDNGNGSNASGFTGLPGGGRGSAGTFNNVGRLGNFWSSSENDSDLAWSRYLANGDRDLNRNSNLKRNGFSVRCLRD